MPRASVTMERLGERFVKIGEIVTRFDIPPHTVRKMWERGDFPRPYRVGPKSLRWKDSELRQWKRPASRDSGLLIYFIRAGAYLKIGVTANLDERLKTIQTGCPLPIELVRAVPGTRADEKRLHRRFVAQRSYGEWFREVDDLAAYIAGFMTERH